MKSRLNNGNIKQNTTQSKPHGFKLQWCFHMAEMERFELSRRFTHPTPLAGEPLRPTWVHLRIKNIYFTAAASCLLRKKWRRRWDSNPRYLSVSLVFKTSSLNPSDTSPHRGKVYRPHQMQHFWQTP